MNKNKKQIVRIGMLKKNITKSTKIEQEERQHLKAVRVKAGDEVILFNGDGHDYLCKIESLEKKQANAKLIKKIPNNSESDLKIHLGQVIIKGSKMDTAIQKAVELGVHKITPLYATRCNVQLDAKRTANKAEHWQKIAVSACEQCGRATIPEVTIPEKIDDWVADDAQTKIIMEPQAEKSIKDIKINSNTVKLLIGCEGGFAQTEIDAAIKNNFQAIKMGTRVLRAETASMAAITGIQLEFGDLS